MGASRRLPRLERRLGTPEVITKAIAARYRRAAKTGT
jgi:hypothetical protein